MTYYCDFQGCDYTTKQRVDFLAHSHYNLSNIITSPIPSAGLAPPPPLSKIRTPFNPEEFSFPSSDVSRPLSRPVVASNAVQTELARQDAFVFDASVKARWQARHAEAASKCAQQLEAIAATKAKIEQLEATMRSEPAWLTLYLSSASTQ